MHCDVASGVLRVNMNGFLAWHWLTLGHAAYRPRIYRLAYIGLY